MARPWEVELRERFPATRTWTYLNSATAGPISYDTARAGVGVFESLLACGDADWPDMLAKLNETRALVSQLAGCDPVELAFTRNTSHSASLVAQMLWDAGHRRAVAFEDEFPSSTLPFINRGFDVRFVKAEDGAYTDEAIDRALEGATVLVASHVMYRTGLVLDPFRLSRLAAARGAHLALCVTQSFGALRVDFHAIGAAFLMGTSHKWMCAGYGCGLLAIRRDLIGQLPWPVAGWLSQRQPELMRNDVVDFSPEARVLEMGCATFPSVLAMGAAARTWLECGPDQVQARVRSLAGGLRSRLRSAGFDVRELPDAELSGIVIVPFPHAEEASKVLMDAHVAQVPRGGGIRFAVHAFNNEADIDRAVQGMVELRAQLPAVNTGAKAS